MARKLGAIMLLSLLAILFRDKKKGGDIVMNINPETVKRSSFQFDDRIIAP